MKPLVAAFAALALASPTLAAALLNDVPVANRIYHGRQTNVRMDAWGMAHPVAFDPRAILPAAADGGVARCPASRHAATLQAAPVALPLPTIAA